MVPKVFLSHASEDKERFVFSFAEKLRAKGIDAWLDRWEMVPGDSIIDKIFEEGLKNAQAVIIVLSIYSINKPWVKEELNAAMVKRINEGSKLIPVVIDDCEVPQCLQSTVWEKINDINNYDQEFDRIIMSIFGKTKKPPLGIPPKYITTITDMLPGLNDIDSLFMIISCEQAVLEDNMSPSLDKIEENLIELQIQKEEISDSISILAKKGYIKISRAESGDIRYFSITHSGFDEYARVHINDYNIILESVVYTLLNHNIKDNLKLAENLKQPTIIINHILNDLESQDLVTLVKAESGFIHIYHISPELKRAFR